MLGTRPATNRSEMVIPNIDIAALFEPASPVRDTVDRAIVAAAAEVGFMTVHGWPAALGIDRATRRALLRVLDLPARQQRRLWRRKFDPAQPNLYRGWYPAQNGAASYKEGIDMGPDIAHGSTMVDAGDFTSAIESIGRTPRQRTTLYQDAPVVRIVGGIS